MGSHLLNSGGSTTRLTSLYSRPASEPRQSGDDLQVGVETIRRDDRIRQTATAFAEVLDWLLDHRHHADSLAAGWLSGLP
jgi:hypothetical protein